MSGDGFAKPLSMRRGFPCIEIANVRLDAGVDPGDEEIRDGLIERINAAHRAAIVGAYEKAAKVTCSLCLKGKSPKLEKSANRGMVWCHELVVCRANKIWKLSEEFK